MDLGHPGAAYKLTQIAIEAKDFNEVILMAKVTLFLSQNSDEPQTFRSSGHAALALAKTAALNEESYTAFLEIISHLRKAMAYDPSNTYAKSNYDKFLSSIDDEGAKQSLLQDSTLIHLKGGLIKTADEIYSKPNMTVQQRIEFNQYLDPRVQQKTKPSKDSTPSTIGTFALQNNNNTSTSSTTINTTLKP